MVLLITSGQGVDSDFFGQAFKHIMGMAFCMLLFLRLFFRIDIHWNLFKEHMLLPI